MPRPHCACSAESHTIATTRPPIGPIIDRIAAAIEDGAADECGAAFALIDDELFDAETQIIATTITNIINTMPSSFCATAFRGISSRGMADWLLIFGATWRDRASVLAAYQCGAQKYDEALNAAAWQGNCATLRLVFELSGMTANIDMALSIAKYTGDTSVSDVARELGASDARTVDLAD
jgi:hypothetical protein